MAAGCRCRVFNTQFCALPLRPDPTTAEVFAIVDHLPTYFAGDIDRVFQKRGERQFVIHAEGDYERWVLSVRSENK